MRCTALADKVMSAQEATAFIRPGDNVGMSGFTGAGYPKAVPGALVDRVKDATARGERFSISVWTGASTAPELDGALAQVDGIDLRMPYQSDPVSRAKINAGQMDYLDVHLSHVAQMVWEGFFGQLDVAVRHLLRHRTAPTPQTAPDHRAIRPDRHPLSAVSGGQDRRDRPHQRT